MKGNGVESPYFGPIFQDEEWKKSFEKEVCL